jgi:hypothetical protein
VEILRGVSDKDQVITTGAAALQDGDRILLANQDGPSGGSGNGRPGAREGQGTRGRNQRPGGGQGR